MRRRAIEPAVTGKTEHLAHLREMKRVCLAAGDAFPSVPQLDAMLDELRFIPRTPRCRELTDLLLDMRCALTVGEA